MYAPEAALIGEVGKDMELSLPAYPNETATATKSPALRANGHAYVTTLTVAMKGISVFIAPIVKLVEKTIQILKSITYQSGRPGDRTRHVQS
jgi:hypothetical protein